MPPIGVLIKPSSSKCNLICKYCFYHTIADKRSISDYGFMTYDTLEIIVKKVLGFASGLATFSFQGGEPTLCGLDFYRKLIELQRKYNVNSVPVENCIQTNGIVINEEWAEFFHENSFLVGLSLDGPKDVNDEYRYDPSGKGTYYRIMKAVDLFNRHKVEYNILFVVTDKSADNADRIYDFFREQNFNFLQFIPCIDPEGRERGSFDYSLHPDKYAEFLKRFFSRWQKDFLSGNDISIRYFDNVVRMFMGMQPETCSMQGQCGCQFVFEADGSVYPCDFYVNEKRRLGNIKDNGIVEMYDSDACLEFIGNSLNNDPACRKCKWGPLCRGGCRRDREDYVTHELGNNYYCTAFKEFFEYALPMIKDIAKYVAKRRY